MGEVFDFEKFRKRNELTNTSEQRIPPIDEGVEKSFRELRENAVKNALKQRDELVGQIKDTIQELVAFAVGDNFGLTCLHDSHGAVSCS